jgi:hypothetical protein
MMDASLISFCLSQRSFLHLCGDLKFWRSSQETWPRVAVRKRDIKIAFRMGLTLAYSIVKHGISLNPPVSKTSKMPFRAALRYS